MKKIVSSIIALGLVFSVTACGSNGDSQSPGSFSKGQQITLTEFTLGPAGEIQNSLGENPVVSAVAKEYGIDHKFIHPDIGQFADALDKMFLRRDYADIIHMVNVAGYAGGDEAAVSDGIFWDLTDYVEQYMPNYYKLIHSDPEYLRMALNDSGRISSLLVFPYDGANQKIELESSVAGLIVRKDWLDESGMDIPVTYKDWEKMLTLFKDKYGCTQPYYLPGNGVDTSTKGFSAGYNAISGMQKNGDIIEYGPMTDGWKEYLSMLHKWYEKGLIGSEYIKNQILGSSKEACISGETGAMLCVYKWVDEIEESISDTADFCAVQYPVKEKGQVSQAGDALRVWGSARIVVTTHVKEENLPRVLQYLDTRYSTKKQFEYSYGKEGDTWEYDKDHNIVFTEKITEYDPHHPIETVIDALLYPSKMMCLKDWKREAIVRSPENAQMCETWDKDGLDLYVPYLQLTAEESEIYDNIMAVIEPYMVDMANKMIVGAVDIDAAWYNYIETLKSMGVEDAIDSYQKAYNRYLHR